VKDSLDVPRWERSFGNDTLLLSLLMKPYAIISNYKDENVNHKYPDEWVSFHMPGSSDGKRSPWL